MRRVLVDYARRQHAAKRGGNPLRLALDDAMAIAEQRDLDLIGLDGVLTELSKLDERQARVVELRFFGGLSVEDTAEVLGTSTGSVKRDWASAKAWLHRRMYRHLRGMPS
jgi:RNA polymerase sigma factor (TIGR02999 family)